MHPQFADMVKLVDMPDLGSGAARRVGSSPIIRTLKINKTLKINVLRVFCFRFCRNFAKKNDFLLSSTDENDFTRSKIKKLFKLITGTTPKVLNSLKIK